MIARLWRGLTAREGAATYERHITENVFPELAGIAGHVGAYLLRREVADRTEFFVMTLWDSLDAIREFAGTEIDRAVVEPPAQEVLVEYDRQVRHFEVLKKPSV